MRIFLLLIRLIALPVAELLFCRWFFHLSHINLHFENLGFVDADLVLPGALALSLFIFVLDDQRALTPERNVLWGVINLVAFASFIGWSSLWHSLSAKLGVPMTMAFWAMLGLSMVISGLFFRLSPQTILANPRRATIVPCILIAFSLVLVKNIYTSTWPWFGALSASAACKVSQILQPITQCTWTGPKYLRLAHPEINVLIGAPCGGIDAVFLFLNCFWVQCIVNKTKDGLFGRVVFVLCGLVFCVILNIVRLVGIFALSLAANRIWGSSTLGIEIFIGFFHAHLGWILYAGAMPLFFITADMFRRAYIKIGATV